MALVAGLGLHGGGLVEPERVGALEHEHLVQVLLVRQEVVQLQFARGRHHKKFIPWAVRQGQRGKQRATTTSQG